MNLKLLDQNGAEVGQVEMPVSLTIKFKQDLVYRALNWHLASLRQGTHSTLTRTEVRGGGKKPWKQKGTGRARAGSIRSPLWRGGGVIFGPKPRDHSFALPVKMRKHALASVIAERAREGKIMVLQALALTSAKTKEMAKVLVQLKIAGVKNLIVAQPVEESVRRAARNLSSTRLVSPGELNIHDLLNCENLIVTREALIKLGENLK
ncbi:MAG: 50S ribosomal protein L4 [Candidatus Margulisiibacteriota bacterium]